MTSQWRMTRFRTAETGNDIFELTHDDPPIIQDGEVLIRFDWISVDPAMSGWTTNKRSYMPPVQPGKIMRAFGIGEVTESKFDGLAVGDWVTGFTGMQTEGVLRGKHLRKVDVSLAPPNHYLSGLGMTGYTGYFGMLDIGQPAPGKTVVSPMGSPESARTVLIFISIMSVEKFSTRYWPRLITKARSSSAVQFPNMPIGILRLVQKITCS